MNTQTPISVDGQAGIFRYARGRVSGLMNNMKREICLLDAKVRTMDGAADEERPQPSMRWCWWPRLDSLHCWWHCSSRMSRGPC